MIQTGTKLKVIDNSGARFAACIKVLNGFKRRFAKIGDRVIVSVTMLRTKRRSQAKILKGKVTQGIILRTKTNLILKNGSFTSFNENSIALVTSQGKPLGTRVMGGVPRRVRYTKYMRLATLSSGILK